MNRTAAEIVNDNALAIFIGMNREPKTPLNIYDWELYQEECDAKVRASLRLAQSIYDASVSENPQLAPTPISMTPKRSSNPLTTS